MIEWRDRIFRWILCLGFLGALGALLLTPINLCAVDIGRHIKNGELLLSGQFDILHHNFYSFTHPDYPFINHHWFFGVLSFLLFQWVGFNGLSFAYALVVVGGFILFFQAGRRHMGFAGSFLLSALCLAVLADRREIRPEGISFLLMGLYVYILSLPNVSRLSFPKSCVGNPAIIFLCIAQILWVNTHIFFFMGPLLVAIFWWQAAVEKKAEPGFYGWLLAVVTAVNILNPNGFAGMLTPFNGLNGFGYRLAENQNVFFMIQRFSQDSAYYWFLVIEALLLVGMILQVKRDGLRKSVPILVLAVLVGLAGIKAVRLMPFTAAFFIFLGARFYGPYLEKLKKPGQAALVVVGILLIAFQWVQEKPRLGYGLMPRINGSAGFYKSSGLKGPIFSNYDIGGYLIYHLAPYTKVFVDNRQEAFPPNFFNEVYIPMQEQEARWQEELGRWGFEVIYFYRHDLTPWGQAFMVARIGDPAWAPVFVDGYTIIFARRGGVNQAIIDRYQLPKEMFVVTKQ